MNKTERQELKSIVRQQFRVLRQEIEHRAVEVEAAAEHTIASRYADEDEAWVEAIQQAEAIMADTRSKIDALFRELPGRVHEGVHVGWQVPRRNQEKRTDLRKMAVVDIEAKVADAKIRLARQEADLLRDLSVGALETDEARRFLSGIPAAAELVPLARLAELEASLEAGE